MQLNNHALVDRHNRPTVMQRVGLQSFFINDGVYIDPFQVSSVAIFRKDDLNDNNITGTIGSDGLVLSSASPYMVFAPSGDPSSVSAFDPTKYSATVDNFASSIFRTDKGKYIVVLDGTIDLSGMWDGSVLANTASSVADYVDIWTVKITEGGEYQTLINDFKLFGDTAFNITQPLLIQTRTHLANRHIKLGSKVNLKFTNEITLQNKDIPQSIINIFNESAITEASVQIVKINEDVNLASRVTIVPFASTPNSVSITADNTLVYLFDTGALQTTLNSVGGGGATGTYTAQVKFNLIDETIFSPLFHFIVR